MNRYKLMLQIIVGFSKKVMIDLSRQLSTTIAYLRKFKLTKRSFAQICMGGAGSWWVICNMLQHGIYNGLIYSVVQIFVGVCLIVLYLYIEEKLPEDK